MRVLATCLLLLLGGCVLADDDLEGTRDIDPSVPVVSLALLPEGGATVEFTFHYELQIVDEEGIDLVWWRYALVRACSDADREAFACELGTRPVLAANEQEMRKPELGKTSIFVEGDRPRKLEIGPGVIQADEDYILWIQVSYRGEAIGHHLEQVRVGGRGPVGGEGEGGGEDDDAPNVTEVDTRPPEPLPAP